MLSRKRHLLRAAATAAFGLAVIVSGPAAAEVDCLPDAVKAPIARPAAPHRVAAHRPVRKAVVHRPRAKAADAVVLKASAPHRPHRPKLRKLAHNGPAKAAPKQVAAIGDARPASAVAGITEAQRAPLIHKVACPTKPVGPPMSILPGTIIEAANQLPFAAPAEMSEAPAVTGVDAVANVPDTDEGLFPNLTFPTRQPGTSFLFPGIGGGGGGGGGGGQPPIVPPDVPPDQPVSPTNPTNPTNPTTPTDQPPFPPFVPGTPDVFTPPGEPEPPGWTPPGGGGPPPGGGGAVPEPATWGLMIMGFGLAGAALRRRRSIATR